MIKMDKEMKKEIIENRINYSLTIISIIVSVITAIISVTSAVRIGKIERMTNSFNVYNGSTVTNNEGMSAEDVDYISSKAVKDQVDWMYEYEEVISAVRNDPNLHFALIWSGSQNEYNKLDESKKIPYVEYQIYDEEEKAFRIIAPGKDG